MLDPHAIMEAVRDPDGRVVDFRYLSVNQAACTYLGLAEHDLIGHTQLETSPNFAGSELQQRYIQCVEDGEPVAVDDLPFFSEILDDGRRYDIRATRAGIDLLSLTWRDVTDRFVATQRIAHSEAILRASLESMLDPHAIVEAVRDPNGRVVDFRYLSVNQAACTYLGLAEEELVGHGGLETSPNFEGSELHQRYVQCLEDGEPVALDDYALFNEILDDGRRYDIRATRAGDDLLSLTWNDVTDRFQAAQLIADSEAILRASVESMFNPHSIVQAVRDPDGRVVDFRYLLVNKATCNYLGLAEDDLIGHTQLETSPLMKNLDLHRRYVQCLEDGEPVVIDDFAFFVDSLDQERRYDIRATRAGRDLISVTWSDVTKRFRAAQQLRRQTDLMKTELDSAASYMKTILPRGLRGPVTVSSLYTPSRELGGDCFNYYWLDDDHLIVHLFDVSGHGIEPALLAVSLQNLLRSGTFTAETLLAPDAVLAELNRMFQMEQQDDHFFTAWYGVYDKSAGTLRYASAGAPPAYAFNYSVASRTTARELSTASAPVGVFEDTVFTSRTYDVPPGCQILIFSDGAWELDLADDQQLELKDFKKLATRLAGSPTWSLDDLVAELRTLMSTDTFSDDCSLIQLTFE